MVALAYPGLRYQEQTWQSSLFLLTVVHSVHSFKIIVVKLQATPFLNYHATISIHQIQLQSRPHQKEKTWQPTATETEAK